MMKLAFEFRLMWGVQKMCSNNRNMLLEPYACSLQVISNYTSAKSNEQKLPHLPVPKLDDTLQKYLKSVRPHLSDEEFASTSAIVKDFAGGIGKKLQGLLGKRAEKHTNWLEEWWLNTAYLEYRDPVVVYSSPGLVFPFRRFCTQDDQLRYAAKTLLAALDYKDLIDNNKIKTEMMGKSPLDMAQYKKIFGTCRVPGEGRDRLSYNPSTQYVTVIHNNEIFHVDVYGEDGALLTEDALTQQLTKVTYLSTARNPHGIGILSSDNRDNWAKAYQALIKDGSNKKALEDIEKSIVVLCLDAPIGLWNKGTKELMQTVAGGQTIHGGGAALNGGNRWFDKTVQFIVGADGLTGLTYEHSPAEGQPIAVMTDFIVNYIDGNKSNVKATSTKPKPPYKLQFTIDTEVERMISTAAENLDRLVDNLDLDCFTFDKYGKNFIKSQKMSPDSYLQMAMQYAFYRIYKVPGAHYESAATRMFVGGRTETIRSCSIESVAFARAMLDKEVRPRDKVKAMRAAVDAHKAYTVQALQGLGVDRHLLGLKLIAKENGIELPKLYTDKAFTKSAHMRLSTSQVACRCDGFMCYGPLVPNGYGTCYNPRDDDMNFAVSAFASNPETSCCGFRNALEQSLRDMQEVLLQATPSKL